MTINRLNIQNFNNRLSGTELPNLEVLAFPVLGNIQLEHGRVSGISPAGALHNLQSSPYAFKFLT
jgi:hypothetical protein